MLKTIKNKTFNFSRTQEEMGIQIYEIEKYLSQVKTKKSKNDIIKEWVDKYGSIIRKFLDSLSDEEIDYLFYNLPREMINSIINKTISNNSRT